MQVDLLVLHTSPQPLDEHVVDPAALAIHADANSIELEDLGERLGAKLSPLVGVEDLGAAKAHERLLQRLYTKVARHRIGGAPRQHLAAVEVQDSRQVDKPFAMGIGVRDR